MISIIIPFYNTEKYIEQCLESVLEQTFDDFEAICVSDGSTDKSEDIVREYADKDSRFKLIQLKKGNAGTARNAGLNQVAGEFVMFLDSDDVLADNALEYAFTCITSKEADVGIFEVNSFSENIDNSLPYVRIDSSLVVDNLIPIGNTFSVLRKINRGVVWDKIYRKKFLDQYCLKFPDLLRCEDVSFSLLSILMAETIAYNSNALAYYRINRKGGLKDSFNCNPVSPSLAAMYIIEELERIQCPKNRKKFALDYCISLMDSNLIEAKKKGYETEVKTLLSKALNTNCQMIDLLIETIDLVGKDIKNSKDEFIAIYDRAESVLNWQVLESENFNRLRIAANEMIEHINNVICKMLSDIPFDDKKAKVGIYGTGTHTKGLINKYKELIGDIKSDIVFVDSFEAGYYGGFQKIRCIDLRDQMVDAIVISSLEHRKAMLDELKRNLSGIKVIDFYDDSSYVDYFSRFG